MIYLPHVEYINGGLFFTEEEWIHPQRMIDSYEIIYVVAGIVALQEDDRQYILNKGDLFLLRPEHLHRGWQTSRGKTSFYWHHFVTNDFESLHIQPGLISVSDNHRFSVPCKQLLHISNTPTYPTYAAHAILLQLLSEISAAQMADQAPGNPLVCEISEYIRINSYRKLSAQDISNHFGYNSDYISVLFRKNFHTSLKRYINDQQITAIKSLLVTTNLSVKELATQTGWDDTNEFIHFFKYHTGISPLQFRNLNNRTHMNNK